VKRLECGLMCLQAVVEGQPMDKRNLKKTWHKVVKVVKEAEVALPIIAMASG